MIYKEEKFLNFKKNPRIYTPNGQEMDFSQKGLKSASDKDFRHFQKVKLQPVQSIV